MSAVNLLDLRSKLILAAIVLALPIGGYYTGKLVEQNACSSKAAVKVLKANVKRKDDDARIDKAVDAMPDATVHSAYMHWVR